MSLEGIGRVLEPTKGRIMVYIPADVHKDSTFPFKPKEKVRIRIDEDKVVIEKIRK
ncbi:MAG: hypothetical protein WC974_02990 [Thermoplasmata archaeon]